MYDEGDIQAMVYRITNRLGDYLADLETLGDIATSCVENH